MINWGRVEELRDEVGVEAFEEVVEIFLEEVNEVVDRLANSPDPGRLADDLHFLKGSALSLGFAEFAAMCQKNEAQAVKDGPETVDIGPLLINFAASKTEFLSGLPGQTAAA